MEIGGPDGEWTGGTPGEGEGLQLSLCVGIAQIASGADKAANLEGAAAAISLAAGKGAELVVLPETFNYTARIERGTYWDNAEGKDGITIGSIARIARSEGVAVLAGSFIEREGERLYNTSCLVTPAGVGGFYRKVHLFEYGKINEGQVITAGDGPAVVEYRGIRIGLSICFDLRFPELYRAEAAEGAEVLAVVAAFLKETGRGHWMPLLRARAIENQAYVVAANQAEGGGHRYYGHSCIIDPWGRVVAKAGAGEEVIVGDINIERVREVRQRLPALRLRRLP